MNDQLRKPESEPNFIDSVQSFNYACSPLSLLYHIKQGKEQLECKIVYSMK